MPIKRPSKKWTIIIFMNAESNILYESFDLFDEIAAVGSSWDVNLVVVFDGLAVEGINDYKKYPSIYLVQKDEVYAKARPEIYYTDPAMENLSDPKNLQRIMAYIKEHFPAENTGFVYTGHGGAMHTDVQDGVMIAEIFKRDIELDGTDEERYAQLEAWMEKKVKEYNRCHHTEYKYYGFDAMDNELNIILVLLVIPNEDAELTFPRLKEALEFYKNDKLAFLCLDCCWGMSVESAFLFKDVAKYLVASTDEMPSTGLGYREMLGHLMKRPRITPDELANLFVSLYFSRNYADYESSIDFSFMGVSLTCLDLNESEVGSLSDSLAGFANYLTANMPRLHIVIYNALHCCKDYTYSEPNEYGVYNIDLVWFLENVIHFNKDPKKSVFPDLVKDKTLHLLASDLIRLVKTRVMKGFLGNNYPKLEPGDKGLGGKGITITFPLNRHQFDGSALASMRLAKMDPWKEMLKAYYPFHKGDRIYFEKFLSENGELVNNWQKLFSKETFKENDGFDLKSGFVERGANDEFLDSKWRIHKVKDQAPKGL